MRESFYNSKVAEKYYAIAEDTNTNFQNFQEFDIFRKYIQDDFCICEFGCGEGSKIGAFSSLSKKISLYGIDISEYGIEKAQEKYKGIKYSVGDIIHTDFSDNFLDVSMSFFVFEHLEKPLEAFQEMYRTTKKGGYIFLWFPNFGSPLFPSPPSLFNKGILKKILLILRRILSHKQIYTSVLPILEKEFEPDYDTRSEINMKHFISYLQENYSIDILESSSKWEITEKGNILFKLYYPFKIFKKSFFKYWGPQCFLILKKK